LKIKLKNQNKNSFTFFAVLGLLLITGIANAQFYNGLQMTFGKNRVQYKNTKDRFWSFYRFEKFDTYFYLGGKELSNYTARYATKQIGEIEKLFDYTLDGRIQFIIFNKLSDLKESNIGLETEQQYNIGGITYIVGTKVVLYFNGDHRDLEKQIKAGITKVMLDQMMYGGKIKDVIRNSTFLSLSEWYVQGLISYMSDNWDVEIENYVKDGILSGKYENFNRLTGDDARYAGHSIWRYVSETYGKQVISNILYMTKVSRNIDSGFLFVLGVSLKNLTYEWLAYYDKLYYERSKNLSLPKEEPLLKRTKPNCVYTQLKASPDGRYNIFAGNEWGKYRVWMQDVKTGKKKKIIRIGHKLEQKTDYSFPLLAWHPSSQLFSMITEHRGKIKIVLYNLQTKKKTKRPLFHFEKILDFSYSDDGKELAMSAVQFGQSDIFVYNLAANTYHQVTKDIWDDFNPRFINKSRELVFASNRNNDTLRLNETSLLPKDASTDIYIYNYKTKSNILKRITHTPNINESQPAQFDSAHIAYLSDANGVNNRFLAKMDSVISYVDTIAHYSYIATSFPVTNYPRSIIQQDIQPKSGKVSEIIYNEGKYFMYQRSVIAESAQKNIELKDWQYRTEQKNEQSEEEKANSGTEVPRSRNAIISVPHEEDNISAPGEIDIDNYTFEGEKRDSKTQKQVRQTETDYTAGEKEVRQFENGKEVIPANEKVFTLPKLRNYDVAFYTDYVVTQLNNNFINSSYQKFTGGGAVFFNPSINGLFKIGISDVMEDYKIVGGFRFSGNLNSNEYFLSYQNFKHRLDQQIAFHRQSFLTIVELSAIKVHTHTLTYTLKYPFSEVASLRGSIIGRTDREVNLSTDLSNLQEKNRNNYLGGLKMEYVFDNTINRGYNLYNGWRYKLFGEYYQHVDKKDARFYVIGLDIRNYTKIHRELIWANRFAASTSFGTEKLIYYLGGVDNWFVPKFDNSVSIATDQNYQYQTVATNMRGFYQNVRNGNSFALFNSEIRFPVFRYLMNRPLRSDFLTNFQIVAFGDIGTAWTGSSPYSEDNFLNTQTIQSGNLVIKIKNSKEPIVGGYGLGVRTRILGYFIRVDYAWGVEDGRVLKPLLYVSLSLDF